MNSKSGFTLVELSIVLVIIGIIIGGILVAASMSDTTKAQAMVREVQQFNIAASNFQTKFNSIPGDSSKVTPTGNGNGIIDDASGVGNASDTFTAEVANFWIQLNNTGFKQNGVAFSATVPAGGITAGINVPTVPYGINGTGAIAVNSAYVTEQLGGANDGSFLLFIGLPSNSGTTITGQPAFEVNQARAIDLKIDDGQPETGIVKAGSDGTGCTTTSNYNTVYSPSAPACNLYIKFTK